MNVWKIGSRWDESGNPDKSILDIFLKYNIVFAGKSTNYIENVVEIGDLIAVADGLTIKAVGRVLEKPRYFKQENKEYFEKKIPENLEKELKSYGIKYPDEHVIALPLKLHKLEKDEYFKYSTLSNVLFLLPKAIKMGLGNVLP